MCYLVVERYSVCRCLYYRHSVDKCAAYGKAGHGIQERTVLVGYSCERHSEYNQETSLWSDSVGPDTNRKNDLPSAGNTHLQGVRITSAVALTALENAFLMDEDDTSTDGPNESDMDTASTQTTVEHDPRYEAKFQGHGATDRTSNLDDLRSRLLHPSQYVNSLQELEESIWNNSIISIYTGWSSDGTVSDLKSYGTEDFIPYPTVPENLQDIIPNRLSDDPFATDPTNTSDEEITALCHAAKDRSAASHLNAIRMCRNVILKTFLNLKSLQQANFCAGSFSAIIVDDKRPDVAMIQPVENTDFIALLFELEYILRDSASLILNAGENATLLNLDRQFTFLRTPMVQQYCQSLLQLDLEKLQVSGLGVVNILRLLVITLDLAVASYAGAHCSDFPHQISTDIDRLSLLAPFEDCRENQITKSFGFGRCDLECLDAFHHGKGVWVFCSLTLGLDWTLSISTTIDGFSDIWGPLWKFKDRDSPERYSAYVVGGGSIVQWKHHSSTCPELRKGEVFCHWISNEELEDDTRDRLSRETGFPYRSFDGTEKLLIGAPSSTPAAASQEPWNRNVRCSVPINEARTRLREAGRLCIVGASKPYHYNDSNQYQLQVGYSGVNASATRQYKRVPGQSLKEVLVELWAMEPEIRDPTLLDDLHGVEISMCTSNAQRVSLAQILRFSCMQHLLRGFNWQDPGYRTEHFLTLEDTLRPKRLLDPLFKERFDYAAMLGLKMLSRTGVDRGNNLQVFLSSTCTPKPELATMVWREHNWIGLLKDTTTECAMVAFGDTCLEFKYHGGVCCGKAGDSAFRSAIIPHSSMLASLQQLRLQEETSDSSQSWMQKKRGVSTLQVGKCFSLGERGNLRLRENLGGGMMVMEWSSLSVKMKLKSRLGGELVHREHTEIDHSEEGSTSQPIPVFVIAGRR
ncbi:hypothetical protein BKA61DRAFT_606729 [Leptodontidium sp. MPI-SDFR-AT-0119]|nr:hypothetical protein BKA61DRAFT_606729 [Leptodontidium sp. MPI-SDFR-AT-0119]